MEYLEILDGISKKINNTIHTQKNYLMLERMYYKLALLIYTKLNTLLVGDNKYHEEDLRLLLIENKDLLILLNNIKNLYKKVNKDNLEYDEIIYYYNTIIDYQSEIKNISKDRDKKVNEIVKSINFHKKGINYIGNTDYHDGKETVEKIKTYSKFIESLY